jgi:uncharacterized protein YegJ (DUF2314 family)
MQPGRPVIDSLAKLLFPFVFLTITITASAAEKPFPSGNTQQKYIGFQLAVFYPDAPRAAPLATLRSMASQGFPGLSLVDGKLPAVPATPLLQATLEKKVKENYAVPDADALKYFGRGLSAAQITAVQGARQVLIMNFVHPATHAAGSLRAAYVLAGQVARDTGGLLWDEETREMFTPDKWQEKRLATWTGGLPDVSDHITVHMYRNGELLRAISLGMGKFGQPDLVVEQFPASSKNQINKLINALAQVLAEGAPVGGEGHIELHLARIGHPVARADALKDLRPKARKYAKLALLVAERDEGDPANRIAAIGFARYPGPDEQARQAATLQALFGGSDSVKYISHDDEDLQRASAAARKKLATMEADFARGLTPGEYLQVKAPFKTRSGGQEWMWVEVHTWRGNNIEGTLDNDPFDVPELHAGQNVKVRLDQVFDYLRTRADGSREGNTTGVIIEKMRGKTRNN